MNRALASKRSNMMVPNAEDAVSELDSEIA